MIAGLFLRNYKIYEKFNFIPFTNGNEENFNLFIGENGAGKSSVLEALDTFFNDRDFIVHQKARSSNSNIAPVFLIEKHKINSIATVETVTLLEKISEMLFTEDISGLVGSNPSLNKFIDLRNELIDKKDTHYLILLGLEPNNSTTTFISMDPKFIEKLATEGIEEKNVRKELATIKKLVFQLYQYLYIPVETSISDFLKLEDTGMQALMDKDLKAEIESLLKDEKFEVQGTGHRTKKVSVIDFVNEKLKTYVSEVQNAIQRIDNSYKFRAEHKAKQNVYAKDFCNVIIDTYFKKRELQKDGKEIKLLSAGERKKALIDIAYSFLSQNSETEKEIILGIDEPESSLHISMCYDQFERIEEMANDFNHQVFVTTHWYGGLPILNKGRLYHVKKEDKPELEIFKLSNYFEERGLHPNDINLKSFYDLTSSIISSIRNSQKPVNWLIVEGGSDKKYLSNYINEDLNLRILPVGGCSIVKKIYEYLFLPLNTKDETKDIVGKIYCLIDSDKRGITLSCDSQTKNKNLTIRRLQKEDDEIKLVRINNNLNTETELEEALNPKKFFEAFEGVVVSNGARKMSEEGEKIVDLFAHYEFQEDSKLSFIKGEESIFKQTSLGRNFGKDMKELHLFFDDYKELICENYIAIESEDSRPKWVEEIVTYFS